MSERNDERDPGSPSLMLPPASRLRLLGATAGGVALGLIAWRFPLTVDPIVIMGGAIANIDRFFEGRRRPDGRQRAQPFSGRHKPLE